MRHMLEVRCGIYPLSQGYVNRNLTISLLNPWARPPRVYIEGDPFVNKCRIVRPANLQF